MGRVAVRRCRRALRARPTAVSRSARRRRRAALGLDGVGPAPRRRLRARHRRAARRATSQVVVGIDADEQHGGARGAAGDRARGRERLVGRDARRGAPGRARATSASRPSASRSTGSTARRVATTVATMLEPGGALVLVKHWSMVGDPAPGSRHPAPPHDAIARLVERHVDPTRGLGHGVADRAAGRRCRRPRRRRVGALLRSTAGDGRFVERVGDAVLEIWRPRDDPFPPA